MNIEEIKNRFINKLKLYGVKLNSAEKEEAEKWLEIQIKDIWNQAIGDAANNADADYTILIEEIPYNAIEVYVIKDSILKLKK